MSDYDESLHRHDKLHDKIPFSIMHAYVTTLGYVWPWCLDRGAQLGQGWRDSSGTELIQRQV